MSEHAPPRAEHLNAAPRPGESVQRPIRIERTSARTDKVFTSLCVLTSLLVSGCDLSPHYQRPPLPVRAAWETAHDTSSNTHAIRDITTLSWREFYQDKRLQALIDIALRNNRDLQKQAAAVLEAQGQYQVQHGSLFPKISTSANSIYVNPSSTLNVNPVSALGNGLDPLKAYTVGIGFSSYEIDFFGRIRNLTRQQAESALSSEFNRRSLTISIVSQVGSTYLGWLADQKQKDLAENVLSSQKQTLALVKARLVHGESDTLTVSEVETQVAQAEANRQQAIRQTAQDEHQLELLIGSPLPETLPPAAPFGSQTILDDIPAGLPSTLLGNRPDILAAEHILKASNANIGAARAAFFPRVTLTAYEGGSSLQFRHLFTPGAEIWAINPSISLPLLSWGQNEGNLKISKARKQEEIADYEKTIQTAFKEVSDALTARDTYLKQGEQQELFVMSSQKAYDVSLIRFKTGNDSYLSALVHQRSLYAAQQSLIAVQLARYQNLITLYRALGGGWSDASAKK